MDTWIRTHSQRARYKIEALFAELKQQIKLRRVRLRRLWNFSEQFHLAARAQNLKQKDGRMQFCSGKSASALLVLSQDFNVRNLSSPPHAVPSDPFA
jgi:hypothetical protein